MPTLGECINVATRPAHAKLNKLIIYRLPRAIPPAVDDTSNYVVGLVHIAAVYSTFEALWQDALHVPKGSDEAGADHVSDACQPGQCRRMHALLSGLDVAGLARTPSLEADIRSMTGWSEPELQERLRRARDSPVLSSFLQHIASSVQARPHVLLAYGWVLYMALFSGGRFVRASLSRVDRSFWTSGRPNVGAVAVPTPPTPPLSPPLCFFSFDTADDGEELKLAFKSRLARSSDALLTPEERDQIVAEAECIFDFLTRIVAELDALCGRADGDNDDDYDAAVAADRRRDDETAATDDEEVMGRIGRLLGLRTRDSVVVTKERNSWARTAHHHGSGSERVAGAGAGAGAGAAGGSRKLVSPDPLGSLALALGGSGSATAASPRNGSPDHIKWKR